MAYNAAPNKPDKYTQGYYKLINKEKYISNPDQIIFRSSLELSFCEIMDKSSKVLKWGSEVVSIPYKSFDNQYHTYHIDFYAIIKNEKLIGGMEQVLIEVKPFAESNRIFENEPPEKPKRITPTSLRNWEYALKEFNKNKLKWSYATEYARLKSMRFTIVTEKTLKQFA